MSRRSSSARSGSLNEAQKNRPAMLNSEISPVNPAATAATATRCSGVRAANFSAAWPISEPPNISCSMGEATESTPMPAVTFRHSIAQISQNCGVLCASCSATLCGEIS